ncbi:uncharacterized protein TNCV_3275411 [Trichonephila clavipes]|nr:uncharacterized protein TNCV_3275411 [Trichonephila clavipes]
MEVCQDPDTVLIRVESMIEITTNSNEFRSNDGTVVRIPDADFNIVLRNVTKNTTPALPVSERLSSVFTNTVVNKKDTKVYEVNTRLAYAMRSVGKGEAAAKVFCGVMNLPPPPKRFYESLHALNNATEK